MAGFTFAKREDIDKAIKLVRNPPPMPKPKQGPEQLPRITIGWIFKTPGGGIAARSGTTPGSASCTPYYIDTDGPTLTELTDDAGASQTVTVYHIGADTIAGDVYIMAKEVYGVLVADMEDCA